MPIAPMQWNDLRLVLAIARADGLAGASEALGVNSSTVFRRINAFEGALGVRLFERLPGGWRPTGPGEEVVLAAERMEEEALAVERHVVGGDARLSGKLRITSSETLTYRVLTRHLASFRRAHPGIVVELAIDNRLLSLSRREADVALRAARPREGDLFGRKLADIGWAVYGAAAYLAENGRPKSVAALARHALIGWDESAAGVRAAEWMAENVPPAAVAYRSSSLVNQLVAAREGIGLAVLPCYLADGEPGLERVLPRLSTLRTELWLVTHEDLRRTARIRAFFDTVGAGLAADRRLLEGRGRRMEPAA